MKSVLVVTVQNDGLEFTLISTICAVVVKCCVLIKLTVDSYTRYWSPDATGPLAMWTEQIRDAHWHSNKRYSALGRVATFSTILGRKILEWASTEYRQSPRVVPSTWPFHPTVSCDIQKTNPRRHVFHSVPHAIVERQECRHIRLPSPFLRPVHARPVNETSQKKIVREKKQRISGLSR